MKTSPSLAVLLKSVSKSFCTEDYSTPALVKCSLEAYAGQINMIIGPSGCGKTTLLSIIAGTLKGDEGEIHVFGNPIHKLDNDLITKFRSRNVGFVFQQFNLIPTLTVSENASLPLLIQGVPRDIALKKAESILERVGLKEKFNCFPKQLSGGQQQRVAIARAIVHDPQLLICDEPTASLDGETGRNIMKLIKEVTLSPNRCVILVSHDQRVFSYADRIIEMSDGKIICQKS